jgi:phosphohistidine phosphatase SixA
MSRTVVLFRHAHAEADAGGGDFERPLSARGRNDAKQAGVHIAATGIRFARVLCSPARRTRETLDAALPGVAAEFESRIYEAQPGTLATLIDAGPFPLLLIGHNPGLEQLVAFLVDGHSDAPRGMPTAAVVQLSIPDGAELGPGVATAKEFWSPGG